MRRIVFIGTIVCTLASLHLVAQPYGNEWIENNQTYFKIPLAETGFYRISHDELQAAGFPVGTEVDPRRIQIYYRGEEIAIHVEGQNDAILDPTDYIEFYGQKNDGTLDQEMLLPTVNMVPRYYNLYSDTSAYFITWRLDGLNGKRMAFYKENNVDGLPIEPYHLDEKIQVFVDNYSAGRTYNTYSYMSAIDDGEGWTGTRIGKGNSRDFEFTGFENRNSAGPDPTIELLIAGRNNNPHNVRLEVGPDAGNLRALGTVTFEGQIHYILDNTLAWSDFSFDGKLLLRLTVDGFPEYTADFVSVTHAKIHYAEFYQIGSLSNKSFSIPVNVGAKSYIEVNGIDGHDKLLDITDPDDIIDIGFNTSINQIDAIVRNTSIQRKLFLTQERLVIPSIAKVNFKTFNPATPDFLIIYHKDFTEPAGDYTNPVQSYASYRASNENGLGPFDTLTIEISTIYNQFSYGEYTPLGILNFCKYMMNEGNPEYLLLIGKGLTVNNDPVRKILPDATYRDWIPSAGFPGSDILFSAGLDNTTYEPAIPTGRITAKSSLELVNYFEKLKETEAFRFEEQWKKDILQLSGGRTEGELALFKAFIDIFKNRAEGLYLGGNATNIYKKTNNVVESFDIASEVNDGKSLVLFFGHSAPGITDIDIGFVSDPLRGYQNKGKYPLMLINGCDAGNIYSQDLTFGEDWIITGDKGAIGFIAHSGTGYTGLLKRFSDSFFETAYQDSAYVHQSLGHVMKEAARRFLENNNENETVYAQVQQNVVQGDPAFQIFGADRPEYAINSNDITLVTTDNKPVNALTDSFDIAVIQKNLGRGDTRPFYMTVQRTISSTGEVINYNPKLFDPTLYTDTLLFNINNQNVNGNGINTFEIRIDPFDSIPEMYDRKDNNIAFFSEFISKPGPLNLYPYDFAIVDTMDIRLVSQLSDVTGEDREFVFQLDTSSNFNSMVRRETILRSSILAEWKVNLFENFTKTDSLTFFWRTKFNDIREGEDTTWAQYSFTYIENAPDGWTQKHIDQLLENEIEELKYNTQTGRWEFLTSESDLDANTFGADFPDKTFEDVTIDINGVAYNISNPFTGFCSDNSINALAFDKATSSPYRVIPSDNVFEILDRKTCGRQPQVINNFLNSEIEGVSYNLFEYIDRVPVGDPVIIFSIGEVLFSTLSVALKNKLTEIGASLTTLNALNDGDPYILLGNKGAAEGTAIEIIADSSLPVPTREQEIQLTSTIQGQSTSGFINSTIIGPSSAWYDFYNRIADIDVPGIEQAFFRISGISQDDTKEILFNNLTDAQVNLEGINAIQYPYLQATFITEDTSALTPVNLESWTVTYEPMPEGIIYPDPENELNYPIEKQEGELVSSDYIFRNISDKDFNDSLVVVHLLYNQASRRSVYDSLKIPPVAANAEANFTVENNTRSMVGLNDLNVIVNPNIIPERYYSNNQVSLFDFLNVKKDNTHPILDVAFDGRYILDGEIVSPSPLISIRYKDDNSIIPKTDTTGIRIFLTYPETDETPSTTKAIYFGNNTEITYTADTVKSTFEIDYKPRLSTDGIYELVVESEDESGNSAGPEPFKVRFEVINESQVTNFYPYPNPFSTSTRFIFTMTGSVIPDQFKIQIMTISGKVVREILQDEIGPIRIGNNITDYAWDGRDEYGDQLANGVYLYRVIFGNMDEEFKHRTTAGDRGFTKGFGKLYLLR